MPVGDAYRAKAAELKDMAQRAANPATRRLLDVLAHKYQRLADQAERNALTDVVYEPPPVRAAIQQQEQQQQQQQQQIQPEDDDSK
jgi:hypothetical protein